MGPGKRVNVLRPGDPFRDWLVHELGARIHNTDCRVDVYKLGPASHTVCRYDFEGENYGVVAKFFAEPIGMEKQYNAKEAMDAEFGILHRVENIIKFARPIAKRSDFNCALVTEYIKGRSLNRYLESEEGLYDKLTSVALLLRRLHSETRSDYHKEREFGRFHQILNRHRFSHSTRETYNQLLGQWWRSPLLDQSYGCLIHNDATQVNYIFKDGEPYAIDFESSWEHANYIHDLGIMASELKNYFAQNRYNDQRAEPYIGHFLWHYSQSRSQFREITNALPFFMSLGLLRIARLRMNTEHRDYLFKEAMACLNAKELME
ncbi:MAG TPA: phosphotransferase [Methanotrichaceae archaeon]|nr:phosphotransferase [Methanotrichaceae archaeon]